jgi:hypothetical protein
MILTTCYAKQPSNIPNHDTQTIHNSIIRFIRTAYIIYRIPNICPPRKDQNNIWSNPDN